MKKKTDPTLRMVAGVSACVTKRPEERAWGLDLWDIASERFGYKTEALDESLSLARLVRREGAIDPGCRLLYS